MEVTKSKIFITWLDVDILIQKLSYKITQEQPQVDSIMGLPRGGLIPAVMLSHKLGLPLVFEPTRKTLIVDDICDSGKTFMEITKDHPYNLFACLHFKPHTSKFIPEIWGEKYEGDDWIVYPWERGDSHTLQDYLK